MIDLNTFEQKFSLLVGRFGKELPSEVIAEYYRMLCDRMTTEQFCQACDLVFFEEDFFPSPQRLLDKVKAKQSDLAVQEWERILKASTGNYPLVELSEPGQKALRSIGGLSVVGYANTQTQLPFLRRDFLEACSSFGAIGTTEQARLGAVEKQMVGLLEGDRDGDY